MLATSVVIGVPGIEREIRVFKDFVRKLSM